MNLKCFLVRDTHLSITLCVCVMQTLLHSFRLFRQLLNSKFLSYVQHVYFSSCMFALLKESRDKTCKKANLGTFAGLVRGFRSNKNNELYILF